MSFSNNQPLVSNQVGDVEFPSEWNSFYEVFDREYKRLADSVNSKEGALYLPYESATFQRYFKSNDSQSLRNIYRKVINFGRLPSTASRSVPHGTLINTNFRLTRLYAASNDIGNLNFICLPFSSPTLSANISLEINNTSVVVTTGSDRSSFTETTVVIEYSKE